MHVAPTTTEKVGLSNETISRWFARNLFQLLGWLRRDKNKRMTRAGISLPRPEQRRKEVHVLGSAEEGLHVVIKTGFEHNRASGAFQSSGVFRVLVDDYMRICCCCPITFHKLIPRLPLLTEWVKKPTCWRRAKRPSTHIARNTKNTRLGTITISSVIWIFPLLSRKSSPVITARASRMGCQNIVRGFDSARLTLHSARKLWKL